MRSTPASTWARAKRRPNSSDELEQVADEGRIVEEIGHQAVDAAEVGRLVAGPFDPAFDQPLAADLLAEHGRRLDAVVHAAAAHGSGVFSRASTVLSASRASISSIAGG